MSVWKEGKLGSFADVQNGYAFKSEHLSIIILCLISMELKI